MKKTIINNILDVTIIILFLISIITVSGISVTRRISDTQDTLYTFIRNTNGNYWEAVGSNIQTAIDDLLDVDDNGYGTVYVGGDVTLTETIEMRRCTNVDFQGHTVTLGSDIPFVDFTNYNSKGIVYSSIWNAHVIITNQHTSAIIRFDPIGGSDNLVRYNTLENIYIENPSSLDGNGEWTEHNYTGIYMDSTVSTQLYNTFRNIHMEGVKYGMHFEANGDGWSNGNFFENIYIDQFETMIWFDSSSTSYRLLSQNLFYNVKGRAASYTTNGIINIASNGNHFDHVMIENLDVATGLVYEYSTNYGIYPFFNLCMWYDGGSYFDDNVASTMIISNGKIQKEYGGG